jgi:hypothetical protein
VILISLKATLKNIVFTHGFFVKEFFSSYEFDFLVEELCSICVAVCKEELMLPVSFWEL